MAKKREPKKGTGKHPGKKYGRRLYTDENPRDTVGIKFATTADAFFNALATFLIFLTIIYILPLLLCIS